jgi:hypothetical protein
VSEGEERKRRKVGEGRKEGNERCTRRRSKDKD